MNIPSFPHNDKKVKVMALLGYTGSGKTTLITASYFQNIIYGEDALTVQFFKRIEQDLKTYGEIPLTLRGEAYTLTFLDPKSRVEFNVQDFSGEHMKLDRKVEERYQKLLERADQSDALILLISAASFYKKGKIQEEIDALQTFVNQLKGLGTRIPVAVILTKTDLVPRFFINLPILRTISLFISKIPFMKIHPSMGLRLTQRRFPVYFEDLNFQGKGPQTVFIDTAMPRLRHLKPWRWPRMLRWIPRILRFLLIEPKWIFKENYKLEEPFLFCFQAFQVGILRDLIIHYHQEPGFAEKALQEFKKALLEEKKLGEAFYFPEYIGTIIEDAHAVIEEIEKEIKGLAEEIEKILRYGNEIPARLVDWLDKAHRKRRQFLKPGGEGAISRIDDLENKLLAKVQDYLQKLIEEEAPQDPQRAFLNTLDSIRLYIDLEKLEIWMKKETPLPQIQSLEKKALLYLVTLTISRDNLSLTMYEEDRNRYQSLISHSLPEDVLILNELVDSAVTLQKGVSSLRPGSLEWKNVVLEPMKIFNRRFSILSSRFPIDNKTGLREMIEKRVLESLDKESSVQDDLSLIMNWAADVEQLLQIPQNQLKLKQWVEKIDKDALQKVEIQKRELAQKAEAIMGTGKNLPQRLKAWLFEYSERESHLRKVGGEKGIKNFIALKYEILNRARGVLEKIINSPAESSPSITFNTLLDGLSVHRQFMEMKEFAEAGISLPAIDAALQSLFESLLLSTLQQRNLTIAIFNGDKQKYLNALTTASPSHYLDTLTELVEAFAELNQNTGRVQRWSDQILNPLRRFDTAWCQLSSRFDMSSAFSLRRDVEKRVVQSLRDDTERLKFFALMKDWALELDRVLQVTEYREDVKKIVEETEEQIRSQLHQDLDEFIENCKMLANMAEIAQKDRQINLTPTWRQFSGSLTAMEYRMSQLPSPDSILNSEAFNKYRVKAPEELKGAMEIWLKTLEERRALSSEWCEVLFEAFEKAQRLLRRPDVLSSLRERVKTSLAQIRRRKRRMALAGSFAFLALILAGVYFLFQLKIKSEAVRVRETTKTYAGDYQKRIDMWQGLLARYPKWLIPDSTQKEIFLATQEIRQFLEIQKIREKIHEGIKKEGDAVIEQTLLRDIARSALSPNVEFEAKSVLLEYESTEIEEEIALWKDKKNAPIQRWQENLKRLEDLQNQLRKIDNFYTVPKLQKIQGEIDILKDSQNR